MGERQARQPPNHPSFISHLLFSSFSRGLAVVHISNDKDMLQLIDEGIHVSHQNPHNTLSHPLSPYLSLFSSSSLLSPQVMDPRSLSLSSSESVWEKFGVTPRQLPDFLALMGDQADNIPGARGVGPKAASRLVRAFDTLETIFESLGMTSLPPPPPHLSDKAALLTSLEEAMGAERLAAACEVVRAMDERDREGQRDGRVIRRNPRLLLASLYEAGLERLVLYRDLIRLRDQLTSPSSSPSPLLSSTPSHPNPLALLRSTSDLRYRGEARLSAEAVESLFLRSLSPAFDQPLQYLRKAYPRLDRS